jgi:biopolymer transport protein ExbD
MPNWDVYRASTNKKKRDVDEALVADLILSGRLAPDDFVRPTGEKAWIKVARIRKYFERLGANPDEPQDIKTTVAATPDALRKQQEAAIAKVAPPVVEEDEGFVRPKRHYDVEEWDLTPMVDMTFLLNMFFIMTTAYALLHSLQIPPPRPADSPTVPKSITELRDDMVLLTIFEDNTIQVDDDMVRPEDLASILRRLMRDSGRTEILITANGDAMTETLVTAIDAANEVGLQVTLARQNVD